MIELALIKGKAEAFGGTQLLAFAGRCFGNSAQFWLDLQSQYDIAVVEREKDGKIAKWARPANAA